MKNKKKETSLEKSRRYYREHPWASHLASIRTRCNTPNTYYKRKGIKNFLTYEDIKFLWFRDKAFKMIQPSIRRKEKSKDYIIDNCHFMELGAHLRLDGKLRTKKSYMKNGKFKNFPRMQDAIKEDKKQEDYRIRKDITIIKVRKFFLKDYTIEEIAKKFKTSKSTIYDRLHRVKKREG
jgi:hypothetical protein